MENGELSLHKIGCPQNTTNDSKFTTRVYEGL